MKEEDLQRFYQALQQNRNALLGWLGDCPNEEIRLAGSDRTQVLRLITDLKTALDRIEVGAFGKCTQCEGEVEEERLAADYTCCVCLSHYSDAEQRALEKELELVSKVHRDLLPCKVPSLPGVDIAAHTEPARIGGGDYYDFFECAQGHGLAIADVMDKGLPASILMSNLQGSLRILAPQMASPAELMHRLNALFRRNLNLIRFISLVVAAVDLQQRRVTYCNAGHHPPLHFSAKSGSINWLNPTGPAIGLSPEATYDFASVEFDAGDILVFYTDGFVETETKDGPFDEQRLAGFVRQHRDGSAADLLNGLLDCIRRPNKRFKDDVTLVILKF